MDGMPEAEPEVIVKPKFPNFFSPKFLAIAGILVVIVLGFIGLKILQSQPAPTTPTTQPQQAAKPVRPLKSLIGTVEAVDSRNSTLTIRNSNGGKESFPVSSDVLISQIVLGTSYEDGKQISLPTNLIYIEDLKVKTGQEVYLVFDQKGENVVQIQMYEK